MSEHLIAVLERCEAALEKPSSLSEPERLRLWRDVGIALHDLRRSERQAGRPRVVDIQEGHRG
jgi:hypothetical protein